MIQYLCEAENHFFRERMVCHTRHQKTERI